MVAWKIFRSSHVPDFCIFVSFVLKFVCVLCFCVCFSFSRFVFLPMAWSYFISYSSFDVFEGTGTLCAVDPLRNICADLPFP